MFIAALVVHAVAKKSVAFADAIHNTVGVGVRAVMATITNWIPFSLAEFLLLSSPILLTFLIMALVRRLKRSNLAGIRYTVTILSLISFVYALFVFGFGTGYYASPVADKVGIERRKLTPEELYETALILIEDVKEELPYVSFPQDTYSAMTFSYSELNEKLNEAYDKLSDTYPEFQRLYSNTKPVMLSEPWTYTHISGAYTFFTGEANVNVNYPDFIVISAAAHELAHQRGITREDDANFIAYLACTMSDDPYIRYSGTLDVLNEVLSKLYAESQELYWQVSDIAPQEMKNENTAYAEFFDQYRKTVVSEVSTAVNNAYITSNNQPEGVKSYGLVVDLVAAYLLDGE